MGLPGQYRLTLLAKDNTELEALRSSPWATPLPLPLLFSMENVMTWFTPGDRFVPSFLDCCLDDTPEMTSASPSPYYQTRREVLDALERDLEALFNTRQVPRQRTFPDDEVHDDSILMYGLPNLACFGLDDQGICRALEETITRFEPRLTQVCVRPERRSRDGLLLHVHITAAMELQSELSPLQEPPDHRLDLAATLSLNPQHLALQEHL